MQRTATRALLHSSRIVVLAVAGACGGAATGSVTSSTGIAGSWSTQAGAQTSILLQLAQAGSSLSGGGTITVPPLAPASGPATPAYTGDTFTITSGTFNAPDVSITATLGANPDGSGGFYRGMLSFAGTQSGNSLTGTLTFTPPRTASQTFAAQAVTGVVLTKP